MDERSLARQADRRLIGAPGRQVCWHGFSTGRGAPPLVLLHGGHGSWLHWARNVEALAGRFEVWAPDMPGYGDSNDTGGTELSSLVDPLTASLDELLGAKTPIRLVGFSFGGLVAATLAARRQHVSHMALFGAAGHGGKRRPAGKLLNWHDAFNAGDASALAEVMRHNLAVHMLHDPASIDDLEGLALAIHTDACIRTRFRSKGISQGGGLADAVARFDGQLLLAWGENDVTADPTVLQKSLCNGRVDCRSVIIPDAGHWVQYEAAAQVNRLLLDWL